MPTAEPAGQRLLPPRHLVEAGERAMARAAMPAAAVAGARGWPDDDGVTAGRGEAATAAVIGKAEVVGGCGAEQDVVDVDESQTICADEPHR